MKFTYDKEKKILYAGDEKIVMIGPLQIKLLELFIENSFIDSDKLIELHKDCKNPHITKNTSIYKLKSKTNLDIRAKYGDNNKSLGHVCYDKIYLLK